MLGGGRDRSGGGMPGGTTRLGGGLVKSGGCIPGGTTIPPGPTIGGGGIIARIIPSGIPKPETGAVSSSGGRNAWSW